MDILLKGVTIIDPFSPFHQQTKDVFIQAGFIAEIGSIQKNADHIISIEGLHISPGWTDIFAHFGDPGFEVSETLQTGALSAAYGGYTDVFVLPNTAPVIDTKSGVEYIIQKSTPLPVTLHPIAAITKNAQGKELAEMYDMHASGAIAFSDGLSTVQSSGVLLKALQYLKAINGTIIQVPDDYSISTHGVINEGIISTQLGLPGKPALAEEVMIMRDIELAKYTASKIHFTGVSTARSVALIKEAKKAGVKVSCSVTPYHLYFTDADLWDYDTNLKLSPPLRTITDREALRQAVLDGTIDCIASHHLPQHNDNKMVEFEYAKDGMIGLETSFAVLQTCLPQLSVDRIVNLLSVKPGELFGLSRTTINITARASISLFQPAKEWMPERFYSKSKNSPFTGKTFIGKPAGIINKDGLFLRP